MMSVLGLIFALCFLVLCWWRWEWGVFCFLALLPSYLIRFNYFGFPTTLLEIMFGVIVLVWLLKFLKKDWSGIKKFIVNQRWFFVFVCIFLLASVVAIFTSGTWFKSLGQWRAYFFEPAILFFILVGHFRPGSGRLLVNGLLTSGALVSLVACLQKFGTFFYPPSLWNDVLDGRVTSFFTSPNAVGLFLVPLFPLAVWRCWEYFEQGKKSYFWLCLAAVLLFFAAILLSFSQGAWIGLGAALIVALFKIGYRKIAAAVVLVGVLVALVVPNIRTAVLFQDKAAQNRLVLWSDSTKFLTADKGNFVFGTGLRRFFQKVEKTHYDPKIMERLIYPHNILLNFWTETGLFGMVGFLGMMAMIFVWIAKEKDRVIGAVLLAIWTGLVVHGLVDVPYFKNDLAFLFWVLAFVSAYHTKRV